MRENIIKGSRLKEIVDETRRLTKQQTAKEIFDELENLKGDDELDWEVEYKKLKQKYLRGLGTAKENATHSKE